MISEITLAVVVGILFGVITYLARKINALQQQLERTERRLQEQISEAVQLVMSSLHGIEYRLRDVEERNVQQRVRVEEWPNYRELSRELPRRDAAPSKFTGRLPARTAWDRLNDDDGV